MSDDWSDLNQIDLRIDAQVETRGFGVLSISSGGQEPPYSYTSGLVLKDIPDLIIFGLDGDLSEKMMRSVSQLHVSSWPYSDLAVDGIFEGYDLALRPVDLAAALDSFMLNTRRYAERRGLSPAGAVQIFWPDANNILPYENGCDPAIAAIQMRIPFA